MAARVGIGNAFATGNRSRRVLRHREIAFCWSMSARARRYFSTTRSRIVL
jgi:hypothetical protein